MKTEFDEKKLKSELKIEAKGLGIPIGSAEVFIERTVKDTKKNLKNRKIITSSDLERIVTKELKKYNTDLAYVFKNRDKII